MNTDSSHPPMSFTSVTTPGQDASESRHYTYIAHGLAIVLGAHGLALSVIVPLLATWFPVLQTTLPPTRCDADCRVQTSPSSRKRARLSTGSRSSSTSSARRRTRTRRASPLRLELDLDSLTDGSSATDSTALTTPSPARGRFPLPLPLLSPKIMLGKSCRSSSPDRAARAALRPRVNARPTFERLSTAVRTKLARSALPRKQTLEEWRAEASSGESSSGTLCAKSDVIDQPAVTVVCNDNALGLALDDEPRSEKDPSQQPSLPALGRLQSRMSWMTKSGRRNSSFSGAMSLPGSPQSENVPASPLMSPDSSTPCSFSFRKSFESHVLSLPSRSSSRTDKQRSTNRTQPYGPPYNITPPNSPRLLSVPPSPVASSSKTTPAALGSRRPSTAGVLSCEAGASRQRPASFQVPKRLSAQQARPRRASDFGAIDLDQDADGDAAAQWCAAPRPSPGTPPASSSSGVKRPNGLLARWASNGDGEARMRNSSSSSSKERRTKPKQVPWC